MGIGRNIKIKHKVLLFPILFTIVTLLVFIIFMKSSNDSEYYLNRIQEGYVPYQEKATALRTELDNLQRGLQDAVAASDEEKLTSTSEIYNVIDYIGDRIKA